MIQSQPCYQNTNKCNAADVDGVTGQMQFAYGVAVCHWSYNKSECKNYKEIC